MLYAVYVGYLRAQAEQKKKFPQIAEAFAIDVTIQRSM